MGSLPELTAMQVQHIAFSLMHTIWQGAIVAATLLLLLRRIPAKRAEARYALCIVALVTVLISGIATWGWLEIRNTEPRIHPAGSATDSAVPHRIYSILVWAWAAGVVAMLARIIISFSQIRQIKLKATPACQQTHDLVRRIAEEMGLVRTLDILVSHELRSPAVLGLLRPILFVPATMLTGLSEDELEAVIAHELAHVRRFDAVVNFCQMLIEAVLFYNPAVWWIGRQIRVEREACCDLEGVKAAGNPSNYSEILARWAESMNKLGAVADSSLPSSAMAFAEGSDSMLLDRVRRVLAPDFAPKSRFSPTGTLLLLLVGFGLLATLWKGTILAVAVVDRLVPHERAIEELTKTRNDLVGDPDTITDLVSNEGSMKLTITLAPQDSVAIRNPVHIYYSTFKENAAGDTQSQSGLLASFHPGNPLTRTIATTFGWTDLLISSEDYAPQVIRNVRANDAGDARITVPLATGEASQIRIVDEKGDGVSGAQIAVSHVLRRKIERQVRPNVRSTSHSSSGAQISTLTTNSAGVVDISNVTEEPLFAVSVIASGFEKQSISPFGFSSRAPKIIKLKRSRPVVGRVVDSDETPVADATIHLVNAYATSDLSTHHFGGSLIFTQKELGDVLATTNDQGEFEITTFQQDRTYQLICSAGEHGFATLAGVRPGDPMLVLKIGQPINIRGTVRGDLERLKKEDGYRLGYGISLTDDNGHCTGDSAGSISLNVVDGVGYFELTNVVPGSFSFHYANWEYCLRDFKVAETIDDLQLTIPSASVEAARVAPTAQTIRLNFTSPDDVAKFRGRIYVESRSTRDAYHKDQALDVQDGQVEFTVNAPSKLKVEILDAPGFVIPRVFGRAEFEVAEATNEVVQLSVPVEAGGLVYGSIAVADSMRQGVDASWCGVSGWMKQARSTTSIGKQCNDDGRFYLPKIPYGSKVMLHARYGSFVKRIDEFEITAERPQVELDVTLEGGRLLDGRVVDDQGDPIGNSNLRLVLFTDKYHSVNLNRVRTDPDGRFRFGFVNPVEGEYFVVAEFKRHRQSAFIPVLDLSAPMAIEIPNGEVISGRLINDESGAPIADAEVFARLPAFEPRRINYHDAEQKTDSEGRFRISNLPSGEFQLGTRVTNARPVDPPVIHAGTKDVELRVRHDEPGVRRESKIPPTL